MPTATVRLQTTNGWETVGKDRLSGIEPSDIQLSANAWGSDTASFVLKRQIEAPYLDLAAFTPCVVEVGDAEVWSGRVWETPTQSGSDEQISVQGRGWQYHLDDDVYIHTYVHSNLTDWVDQRTFPTADLTKYRASGAVNSGNGALELVWAKGEVADTNQRIGVTLDLGVSDAKRVYAAWTSSNNAVISLIAEAHNQPSQQDSTIRQTLFTQALSGAGTSGTNSGTATTAQRYVTIYLDTGVTAANPWGADIWVRLNQLLVVSNTAYESSGTSVLKVSDIVKLALPYAPLLSQDTSRVSTTSFNVPDASWIENKTPREIISAYNAYHAYRSRVDTDALFRFDPLPSVPKFESSGSWQGVDFTDASANSGQDIYNRCIAEATGPAGETLRVSRRTTDSLVLTDGLVKSAIQPSNPSADVDASGWSYLTVADGATTPGLTRKTDTPETAPGYFNGANPATGQTAAGDHFDVTSWTGGTFKRGITYVAEIALMLFLQMVDAKNVQRNYLWEFGDPTGVAGMASGGIYPYSTSTWGRWRLTWTPQADIAASSVRFRVTATTAAFTSNSWDSLTIYEARPTIPDRTGFLRTMILPLSAPATPASATQLADIFLQNHRNAAFKGDAQVRPGGLHFAGGGTNVHPSTLLTNTGELVRFLDRVDPDTGAEGRDGRIASVTYNHSAETAAVSIDNERRNFEAMLSRLGALVH
jgi:hypothetical protein